MPRFAPYKSTLNLSTIEYETNMKDDHRYDTLRNVDASSDSSTEVDEEWDPESEIQPRRRAKRRAWMIVKAHRWVIDTALLLVILGLLVEKGWRKHDHRHRYEFTGDLTGFAPQCRSIPTH